MSWLNFESAKKTEYFDFAGDELMSEYIDAAMAYALPWTEDELAAAKALGALSVVYSPLNGAGRAGAGSAQETWSRKDRDSKGARNFPMKTFRPVPIQILKKKRLCAKRLN